MGYKIFAFACFFIASVLISYLVTPREHDSSGEVLHVLEEMRSCLSSLGDLVSRQNDCFLQAMGAIGVMNGKLDGMFSVMNTPGGKGKMGEWKLESLLKSIRTNGGPDYLVKPSLKGGKPDFAIPVGDKFLYIDSKFPHDSYKSFLENPKDQTFKAFILAVKRCADAVREKYVSAEDSVGMAVLYLPVEGMMRDILKHYPRLALDLENKGVVLLSSLYLPYFLHMFVDCFSQLDWERNFVGKRYEISSLVSTAEKKLFDLGKNIDRAEISFAECKRTISDLSDLLRLKHNKETEMSRI